MKTRRIPVIGLEVHVQLKTATKMFCSCPSTKEKTPSNTTVCSVCLGHPGTLPSVNAEAVRLGVRLGLALNCTIPDISRFDRKNYFYPDLTKGYQISQYDVPIAEHGSFVVEAPGLDPFTIRITRAHLEEDTGKSFHGTKKTLLDFNRAGLPLVEIVTEPDFTSPEQAKAFLQELRLLCRSLGISDAEMEKGQLRCDANISLREVDEEGLVVGALYHPKTEVKNMNSFKAVERALQYEIARQEELWVAGTPPSVSTTRGWNEKTQKTALQRDKEASGDYRYFPEPDLPPLSLVALREEESARLQELPSVKRLRFREEYRLSTASARELTDDIPVADYAEQVFSELQGWLMALPALDGAEEDILQKEREKLGKLVHGWLISKLGGILAEQGGTLPPQNITPENFAEFLTLIATRTLSTSNGLKVLTRMAKSGEDPSQILEDGTLTTREDDGEISETVLRVLARCTTEVQRYQKGEKQLLAYFLGQVLKETGGAADPVLVKNMLLVELEKN